MQPDMVQVAGAVQRKAQCDPPLHCTVQLLTPLHSYSHVEPPLQLSAVDADVSMVTWQCEPIGPSVVHFVVALHAK